ncbi:MAG: TraR/DksA family transcriptional regulator [Desulfobacteraceae bacterium]|nr:MAG: TraR/DksA family transcriptional regulator [Desulfobacteraceae bacterium]
MDYNNREKLMKQLNMQKRQFEQVLQRLMKNQKEYNDYVYNENLSDEVDHAQREISAHRNYSLIEKKTRELEKIDRLMQKISRDEGFGECEECGDLIPPERLLIVPETSLCIDCQRELEKLSHHRKVAFHE